MKIILLLAVFLFVMLAWCPWITREYAEVKTRQSFRLVWQHVIDGCGITSIDNEQKKLFGYTLIVRYACGLTPPNYPVKTKEIFISAFGTISGIPTLQR